MDFIASLPLVGPILFWVLPFIVVLSIVVFVHELGHLVVGRWCGIKAEVFSIGFGKVLFGRTDRHGTRWQVAVLPFGGFVKFLGDIDPSSAGHVDDSGIPPHERRHAFHNASVGRRALTVAAGPVANFILSAVIFFGLALHVGKASPEPVIGGIGALAEEEIGFRAGDRVLRIGDVETADFSDIVDTLANAHGRMLSARVRRGGEEIAITTRYANPPRISGLQADGAALAAGVRAGDTMVRIEGRDMVSVRDVSVAVANLPPGKEIVVTVEREGRTIDIPLVPDVREREHPVTGEIAPIPILGISMSRVQGLEPTTQAVTLGEAAAFAVGGVWKIVSDTLTYVRRMIFEGADTSHLSGPIGIAKHSTDAAEAGLVYYIRFIAFVSTAIGLLNLFPIPILDGGHLIFYAIEAMRRRPINAKIVQYGTAAGLTLLLLIMVFVTINNDLGLGDWLSRD